MAVELFFRAQVEVKVVVFNGCLMRISSRYGRGNGYKQGSHKQG